MSHTDVVIARLGLLNLVHPDSIPSMNTEIGRILYFMSDRKWHSAYSIKLAAGNTTGDSLRTMRKLREWTIFHIEKRKVDKRMWEYRLDIL
jgi:hypothetical protein